MRIEDLDRLDLPEARAVKRLAGFFRRLEREAHVLGGQRVAIGETGTRIEIEGDGRRSSGISTERATRP